MHVRLSFSWHFSSLRQKHINRFSIQETFSVPCSSLPPCVGWLIYFWSYIQCFFYIFFCFQFKLYFPKKYSTVILCLICLISENLIVHELCFFVCFSYVCHMHACLAYSVNSTNNICCFSVSILNNDSFS